VSAFPSSPTPSLQLSNCQVLLPRMATSMDHLDVSVAHVSMTTEFAEAVGPPPEIRVDPSLVGPSPGGPLLYEHQVWRYWPGHVLFSPQACRRRGL
jgi:hypothetical protein